MTIRFFSLQIHHGFIPGTEGEGEAAPAVHSGGEEENDPQLAVPSVIKSFSGRYRRRDKRRKHEEEAGVLKK